MIFICSSDGTATTVWLLEFITLSKNCNLTKYCSQRNSARYKQLQNQTVQPVRNDHENYRKKVIRSFKENPKKFFGYMRSLQTVKPKVTRLLNKKGELSETNQEAAEVLCEFFQEVFLTDKKDNRGFYTERNLKIG